MKKQELLIDGMSCGHCVKALKNELTAIQEKLSENLDIIFDNRSQELTNVQDEVFQNLENIFETNLAGLFIFPNDLGQSKT